MIAELLAAVETALQADAMLSGVPVVVDREQDIAADIEKAVSSGAGLCLLVSLQGGPNVAEESARPLFNLGIGVAAVSRPDIRAAGTLTASAALELVILRLHKLTLTDQPKMQRPARLVARRAFDLVDDAVYLVYAAEFAVRRSL